MRAYLILMIFFTAVVLAENNIPPKSSLQSDERPPTNSLTKKSGWLGKKSCIVINATRERICNTRALTWCTSHKGASECQKFQNIDVSK